MALGRLYQKHGMERFNKVFISFECFKWLASKIVEHTRPFCWLTFDISQASYNDYNAMTKNLEIVYRFRPDFCLDF